MLDTRIHKLVLLTTLEIVLVALVTSVLCSHEFASLVIKIV